MLKEIIIYGAGGFGREVAWLIESCNKIGKLYNIACFVDDNPQNQGNILNTIPIVGFDEARIKFPNAKYVLAIGSPQIRETIAYKVSSHGFDFETIIHPNTDYSQWIDIGLACVICSGNILTTNINIGNHVQINLDCTIGHDVILSDYVTLAPGVHVSGCVNIGKRAYIGTGAVIINGTQNHPIIIGDDAIVGAGACVTKSVAPSTTVVGVPAKPLFKA